MHDARVSSLSLFKRRRSERDEIERNKVKNKWAKKRERHGDPLLEEDDRKQAASNLEGGNRPDGSGTWRYDPRILRRQRCDEDGESKNSYCCRRSMREYLEVGRRRRRRRWRRRWRREEGEIGLARGRGKVRGDRKVRDEERSCGTKTRRDEISLALSPRLRPRWGRGEAEERRLCTTSGAREGSFSRFGEGHGGVVKSGRGAQGGMLIGS